MVSSTTFFALNVAAQLKPGACEGNELGCLEKVEKVGVNFAAKLYMCQRLDGMSLGLE